jgi:hypothetical protein
MAAKIMLSHTPMLSHITSFLDPITYCRSKRVNKNWSATLHANDAEGKLAHMCKLSVIEDLYFKKDNVKLLEVIQKIKEDWKTSVRNNVVAKLFMETLYYYARACVKLDKGESLQLPQEKSKEAEMVVKQLGGFDATGDLFNYAVQMQCMIIASTKDYEENLFRKMVATLDEEYHWIRNSITLFVK